VDVVDVRDGRRVVIFGWYPWSVISPVGGGPTAQSFTAGNHPCSTCTVPAGVALWREIGRAPREDEAAVCVRKDSTVDAPPICDPGPAGEPQT
jgi:hypothetical protein